MCSYPFKLLLTKILLTVVCGFAPFLGYGAGLCSTLFSDAVPQDFFGYFKMTKQQQERLEMRRNELLSQNLIQESDVISQSGISKRMSRTYEVKFPQDRNLETTISIYGEPYVVNDIWYVDFKIWSREWGNDRLIHDRETFFLRRMTLEQFLLIGKDSFISSLKNRQKYIYIDAGKSRFDLLPFDKLDWSMDKVTVRSSNAKTRIISLHDIAKWNLSIKEDEVSLFSNFFLAGGKGFVLSVVSALTISNFEYARNYLIVEKLPAHQHPKLSFLISIESILATVISENVTIAIVAEGNGILAATATKLGDEIFDNHVLAITPKTHKYLIDHELKHIEDARKNVKAKIIAELKTRFPSGKLAISSQTLARFITLISEQRAYQTQFESMSRDANQFDFLTFYGAAGPKQMSYADFIKAESVHVQYFRERYVVSLKNDLRKLKISHYQEWIALRKIVAEYTLPSEYFSLAELFDQ